MAKRCLKRWKTLSERRNCFFQAISFYKQILLFPQCFQKTCTADMSVKPGLVWERAVYSIDTRFDASATDSF